ncbi:2-nitropropane dioxygenase, partial [Acinetobacter baumannii]
IRAQTNRAVNVNFFAHTPPEPNPVAQETWRARLAPYYTALGLDPAMPAPTSNRAPFDDAFCTLVERYRPEIVSFHFGLPET